jgi:hypothetical protein
VHLAIPVPVEGKRHMDSLFAVLIDVENVGDGLKEFDKNNNRNLLIGKSYSKHEQLATASYPALTPGALSPI